VSKKGKNSAEEEVEIGRQKVIPSEKLALLEKQVQILANQVNC